MMAHGLANPKFRYNLDICSSKGIHDCHWEEDGRYTVGLHNQDKKFRI
jgi:hypothetical protein